jgi:hypothetical protein
VTEAAAQPRTPRKWLTLHVKRPRCPRCNSYDLAHENTPHSDPLTGAAEQHKRCRGCGAWLIVLVS